LDNVLAYLIGVCAGSAMTIDLPQMVETLVSEHNRAREWLQALASAKHHHRQETEPKECSPHDLS
jgi:hypothetical protein